MKSDHLYFPQADKAPDQENVWAWYGNIAEETQTIPYSLEEREHLDNYYREAGLSSFWRRPYFRKHFSNTFADAAAFLLLGSPAEKTILDLGCGCGTQTLFLAAHGAHVIAFDRDRRAQDILLKRQKFYEDRLGRKLNISIINADSTSFRYEEYAPIHGLYSMFAFNMMQPTDSLLEQLLPVFSENASIAIQDGSTLSWVPRIFPKRRRAVMSPIELSNALNTIGFKTHALRGTVSLFPLLWRVLPGAILNPIDNILNRTSIFPISYQILAQRQNGPSPDEVRTN